MDRDALQKEIEDLKKEELQLDQEITELENMQVFLDIYNGIWS